MPEHFYQKGVNVMARDIKERKDADWIELCEYIKKEILNYDEDMKFPRDLALRIRGLQYGQYVANNNIDKAAKYDVYTLLCTFKLCRSRIVNYLETNESKIKDEKHKINIIMKIVEQEVNDVHIRLKQAKQSQQKIERASFDTQQNTSAQYTKKTKDKNNKKLNDLF